MPERGKSHEAEFPSQYTTDGSSHNPVERGWIWEAHGTVLEFVKAGGWLMLPIIACSVVATTIIAERLWTLRHNRVLPKNLVAQIWKMHRKGSLTNAHIITLRQGSPLGRILAAGLVNRFHSREVMKEAIEEVGRQVVFELERYLNTLGTIASIAPLLGLLGTVVGMIKVFSAIVTAGVGNTTVLAGGISEALKIWPW